MLWRAAVAGGWNCLACASYKQRCVSAIGGAIGYRVFEAVIGESTGSSVDGSLTRSAAMTSWAGAKGGSERSRQSGTCRMVLAAGERACDKVLGSDSMRLGSGEYSVLWYHRSSDV